MPRGHRGSGSINEEPISLTPQIAPLSVDLYSNAHMDFPIVDLLDEDLAVSWLIKHFHPSVEIYNGQWVWKNPCNLSLCEKPVEIFRQTPLMVF